MNGKAADVRSQLLDMSKKGGIVLDSDFNVATATKDAMAKLIVEQRLADAKADEQELAKQWQDRLPARARLCYVSRAIFAWI
eukprot:590077-Alexandrium_andersonii.AAC.1